MNEVPRCPRCKQQNYSLAVVTEEEFTSEVVNGRISGCAASSMPTPVRAYGSCTNCGHKWRIKNASTRTLNSYDAPNAASEDDKAPAQGSADRAAMAADSKGGANG